MRKRIDTNRLSLVARSMPINLLPWVIAPVFYWLSFGVIADTTLTETLSTAEHKRPLFNDQQHIGKQLDRVETHKAVGRIDKAVALLLNLLPSAQSSGDSKQLALVAGSLSDAYLLLRDLEKAAKYLDLSRQAIRNVDDPLVKATVLNYSANLHMAQSNHEDAIDRYDEALRAAKLSNNNDLIFLRSFFIYMGGI